MLPSAPTRLPWQAPTLLAILVACGEPAPPPEPAAPPTLRIGGSETLTTRLVPDLVAAWAKVEPDVAVEVTRGGSGKGIKGLLARELDLAASSRDATPSEDEQAKVAGWSLSAPESRHIIGVDVIAVAVHESNPVQALTFDEVIAIFCTGSITSWSQLGGEDKPIRAITRDPESGTRAMFEDFFCGVTGIHPKLEVGGTEDLTRALREDPASLAYVTLSEQLGRAVPLKADPEGTPFSPTLEAITTGSYPLFRDLVLYSAGPPTGPAADFLAFVAADGQSILSQHGFVALNQRPAKLDGPRPQRETVHFDAGATEPNQLSRARLALLVKEIQERKLKHVVLEGYADNTEEDGVTLSQQRAETVQRLLAAEAPDLYFEVIPRGSVDPIAPNDTAYGRLRNRRVQVYFAEEEAEGAVPSGAPTEPPAP